MRCGWRDAFLTFGLTQVITGHGCFERFLFRIRRDDKPGCHHCVDRPEGTVEHTVEVCPACAVSSSRRSAAVTFRALVEPIVQEGPEVWEAVTSFYEAVMQP